MGDLQSRRQLLDSDRFLTRLFDVLEDSVIPKGGLVIELRLERARTTKNVDLPRPWYGRPMHRVHNARLAARARGGIELSAADAKKIAAGLEADGAKMGEIKKLGKTIKSDHALAMELWATGGFRARLLATLIFDKRLLNQQAIDALAADLLEKDATERNRVSEWLLANQLMKSKPTIALLESWRENDSPVLRRLFWYHQARLRWTGQTPPGNTGELVDTLERHLATAHPDVQWAMNFCAGWIGVHDEEYRSRCIDLGKKAGLYKDEVVPKNCTPSYLPEFIRIEVAKRE